jgi:hypothetical protein
MTAFPRSFAGVPGARAQPDGVSVNGLPPLVWKGPP